MGFIEHELLYILSTKKAALKSHHIHIHISHFTRLQCNVIWGLLCRQFSVVKASD